ncbi:MAG: MBL fold metallo-hydrolase [Bacteroidales bacterium]|nr:MBL fold metallo-hydrolase [Bacteroidales bacterium]
MKTRVFVTLILVTLGLYLFSQCKQKEMEQISYTAQSVADSLHWIKQSCIKLQVYGKTIYFDPLGIKKADSADFIFITHPHGDHFSPADIAKIATSKTVIYGPKECRYTGTCKEFIEVVPGQTINVAENISITTVPAYNVVKTNFHPKEKQWVGYLLKIGNIVVYHAGDTERIPEMKNFTAHIAMLPLGQTYTMNSVEEAAEAAKDVKAEIAIPIHWGAYEGTAADAQKFKSLLENQMKVIIKSVE